MDIKQPKQPAHLKMKGKKKHERQKWTVKEKHKDR